MHGQAADKMEFEEIEAEETPSWPESFQLEFVTSRAVGAMLHPKVELAQAKKESATPRGVFVSFLVAIAAIPPICEFIRMVTIGRSLPFMGTFKWPVLGGFIYSVMQYGLTLAFIGITAWVACKLSPYFEGETSFVDALKLIAIALTPGCLAGVLNLVPYISILSLVFALYGFYIFYIGIPVLTNVKRDRRVGYLFSTIICSVILGAMLTFIVQGIAPSGIHPRIEVRGDAIEFPGGEEVDISTITREVEKLQKLVPAQTDAAGN